MYKVRVWPDGSWIGEDDWETIPEDHSDDFFTLNVPDEVMDADEEVLEQFIVDNTPGL